MNDDSIIRAYERVQKQHSVSADKLVCSPEDRERFLTFAREELGNDISEFALLWRLICLRKQSRLPRTTVAPSVSV